MIYILILTKYQIKDAIILNNNLLEHKNISFIDDIADFTTKDCNNIINIFDNRSINNLYELYNNFNIDISNINFNNIFIENIFLDIYSNHSINNNIVNLKSFSKKLILNDILSYIDRKINKFNQIYHYNDFKINFLDRFIINKYMKKINLTDIESKLLLEIINKKELSSKFIFQNIFDYNYIADYSNSINKVVFLLNDKFKILDINLRITKLKDFYKINL